MKYLLLSVFLLTSCVTLLQSRNASHSEKLAGITTVRGTWLQFGYHARKAGIPMSRWEEASPKIKAKLKNKPGNEHLSTLLAGALYVERKYQQAYYQAKLVLKLNPNNRSARNILGLCLLAQGKTEQANAELMRAFKTSNHEIASGLNLGFIYLQQRHIEAAKDIFLQVQARCPTCQDAALGLGISYYLQKDYTTAISTFKKSKKNANILYHLGLVYRYGQVDLDKAAKLFTTVSRSRSASSELKRKAISEKANIDNMQMFRYDSDSGGNNKDGFKHLYLLNAPQHDFD